MKITWLGHSAFRIETAKAKVLIDPVFTGNPALDEATYAVDKDEGLYRLETIGLETGAHLAERYRIRGDDPLSAHVDHGWVASLGRGDWQVRTEGRSSFAADGHDFHVTLELDGYEGEKQVFTKRWERKIPRDPA